MADLKILAIFDGNDGNPTGTLTVDAVGNLYGTTEESEPYGQDTVFELVANSGKITRLVSVDPANGAVLASGVVRDASGNLYGAAAAGGQDDGTVFEVADATHTLTSTPFTSATTGSGPFSPLAVDAAGNYYGTTISGGAHGDGTIYKFDTSTKEIEPVVSFDDSLLFPGGGSLVIDSRGNLFGTSRYGGTRGDGAVYEVAAGTHTAMTIAQFNGTNGSDPASGLVADPAGNLYGTTSDSTIFEVKVGADAITTLASTSAVLGGGLLVDAAGDLFGEARGGRANDQGIVYELVAGTHTLKTVATFASGIDAGSGLHGLTVDSTGNLYGIGDGHDASFVFEVKNSGFVLCFRSGTLIGTPCGDVAVEALQVGDKVTTWNGGVRAIRWLGRRVIDCARHPVPSSVWPVRVRAGAFDTQCPRRDLYLSPGHPVLAVCDGREILVPIMCLINGTSIAATPLDRVTYWHIELDEHDILLAEGLPAESYVDLGTRSWFENDADHALVDPDFIAPGLGARCRPVEMEGPLIEAERRRIDDRFYADLTGQCFWPGSESAAPPLC